MSQKNVELARSGFMAVSRGEVDVLGDMLDPNVEWHGSDGPTDDSCHNRDEAIHFIALAIDRGVVGDLVDVIDAGDQVVVVMRPPNQKQLRANLTTFRDGKVVRMVAYESRGAALAAVGLAD
jgi:ketosteroid isomerase-like protein